MSSCSSCSSTPSSLQYLQKFAKQSAELPKADAVKSPAQTLSEATKTADPSSALDITA